LLFEKDGSDAVQIRYLYGPGIDHILESVDSVGTKQHFADALGSVTRITNSTGTRQKLMVYDSYGVMNTDSGSVQADYVSQTSILIQCVQTFMVSTPYKATRLI
jgi:hypothetical protein